MIKSTVQFYLDSSIVTAIVRNTILIVCVLLPSSLLQAQKIRLDKVEYDFGVLDKAQVVTHTIVVHNDGDKPLELYHVKASCGCAAVQASKNKVVEPGKSTEINVAMRLSGMKGKTAKTVSIQTNDPKKPLTSFTIFGVVFDNIQLSQEIVDFGKIDNAEKASGE